MTSEPCKIVRDSINRPWVVCKCGRKLPFWNSFGEIQEAWRFGGKVCRFCGHRISDTIEKGEK